MLTSKALIVYLNWPNVKLFYYSCQGFFLVKISQCVFILYGYYAPPSGTSSLSLNVSLEQPTFEIR